MKRVVCIVAIAALVIALSSELSVAQVVARAANKPEDPVALGQPLSHWLKVIRSRDPEEMETAYDAIVELGPAAWTAVPDLTRIVAEPFTPIRIGVDDRREILAKLLNIHLRAGAVDSLGAIGTRAASAANPVIQWALTIRIVPSEVLTQNDGFYIELVGMDVLERMRGAGATARFGAEAADAVQELIESGDGEKRKLAVAILNEGSLPMLTDLMTSKSCRDRMLGLAILADMWPVVAIDHLKSLKDVLACSTSNPEEGVDVGSVGSKRMRFPRN
jgi:hypothetical protein